MSLFVCKDPITRALRDFMPTFHLIRVPESAIQPLVVLVKDPDQKANALRRVGPLSDLLANAPDEPILDSRMADLSGKKSTDVKVDLGLQIVSGFLSGFGVNPPSLKAVFDQVSTLSFSFEDVHRQFIDQTKLGDMLLNQPVELANPAVATVREGGRCLVIDSEVVSNNFSVRAERTTDANFAFDLGDIKNILEAGAQKVAVKATNEKTIQFKGEAPLAFAFTCVELFFDDAGQVTKFLSVKPGKQSVGFGASEEDASVLETEFEEELEMLDISGS
ncbi:MAG: hypothetical protein H7Z75_20260 [Ferruginibacter sp.]|nr:hypothetical protein [Cytophagales bacterium]